MAVKPSILFMCCLLAGYVGAVKIITDPVQVEVGTSYVTRDVQKPEPNEKQTFVASTCKQFIGDAVNVTVLLNSNPEWNVILGVVYFYVVDDPTKPESQALCTNRYPKPSAVCFVDNWKSNNDLYVMTTAGDVNTISFTLNVQFVTSDSKINVGMPFPNHGKSNRNVTSMKNNDYYYLSEIVHISKNVRLQYEHEVILNVSFCPNAETSKRYTIQSEIFGTDGISAYTQYICTKLPCEVDNPNVIKSNPNQLLTNTIFLSTTTGEYQHLYVVIVNWGGNYDPTVKTFVGEFQYAATITRNP